MVGILDALTLGLVLEFIHLDVASLEEGELGETLSVLGTEDALVGGRADRFGLVAGIAVVTGDALNTSVVEATESIGAVSVGVATLGTVTRSGRVVGSTPRSRWPGRAVVRGVASNAAGLRSSRVGTERSLGVGTVVVGGTLREIALASLDIDVTNGNCGQVAYLASMRGTVGVDSAALAGGGVEGDAGDGGSVVSALGQLARAVTSVVAELTLRGGGGVEGESLRRTAGTRGTNGDGGGGSTEVKSVSQIADVDLTESAAVGVVQATANSGQSRGQRTEISGGEHASRVFAFRACGSELAVFVPGTSGVAKRRSSVVVGHS